MKYIAIITATDEEIEAIKSKFLKLEEKEINYLKLWMGEFNDKNYILVKAGIGKVNAARTTQMLIDKFEIEYVINVGVAGSVNDELNIGDLVIGKELVQHDMDMTAFGYEKGFIEGIGKTFYSDDKLIESYEKYKNNNSLEFNSFIGTIATGDLFCTDMSTKKYIQEEFNAYCVEMEGAAIAQVCTLNKIPFLVIRAISDKLNGENQMDYCKFAKMAANNCAKFVFSI